MSIVLNEVKWGQNIHGLLTREIKLFLILALYAKRDGTLEVQQRELGEVMGMNHITVRRALRGLDEKHLITIQNQTTGPGATVSITLNPKWISLR